jgi:hypothetical protein
MRRPGGPVGHQTALGRFDVEAAVQLHGRELAKGGAQLPPR